MKIILWIALVLLLLVAGFAAGFPYGKSVGFDEGSEWAIIQAEIFAREAGVFMPVTYEEGQFKIIIRQPGNLHKTAWRLADRYYQEMKELGKDASAEVDEGVQEPNDISLGENVITWKESVKQEETVPASYVLPQLPEPSPALLFDLIAVTSEEQMKM